MLHQLKNGNWIDLNEVNRVGYFDSSEWGPMIDFGWTRKDRRSYTVVTLKSGRDEQIHFDTMDEVLAYRDELAGLVNAARSEAARNPEPPIQRYEVTKQYETSPGKIRGIAPGASFKFDGAAMASLPLYIPNDPPSDPFAKDWSEPDKDAPKADDPASGKSWRDRDSLL